MTNTMTKTTTIPKPAAYPDPATLRRVWVQNGKPKYQYYADERGSLFYKTDAGGYVFMAQRRRWTETEGPGKVTPDPAPTPAADRIVAEPLPAITTRRYSFAYRTLIGGIAGELTIEASSAFEMTNALKQAITHFKPVVEVPKAEDEFFVMLADGSAFCRRHNAPMVQREKQGDKWWSHSVGDECWCRGRPGKDSPGWEK